jgi:hypothetical protein
VRLHWTYARGREDRLSPNLANPRLEGAAGDAMTVGLWTLEVPLGFHAASRPANGDGATPASAVVIELRRAEALVRLTEALVQTVRSRGDGLVEGGPLVGELGDLQARLAQSLRAARKTLTQSLVPGTGPRGQALAEWLLELEQQNEHLARDAGFETIWSEAREAAAVSSPPTDPLATMAGSDRTLYWHGVGTTAPDPRLSPDAERQAWRSLAASGLLLAVLLMSWVLSFAPGMFGWARTFWPEQMVLLACLGWQTVGLNGVVVLLAAVGVSGRVVVLAIQGVTWLLRPRREANAGPASHG